MKTIERGLVKTSVGYIHYRATGAGRPLVLMHVNGSSSTSYMELMEVLPADVRAIALDFPNCGFSDHVEQQLFIADYARVVAEVMDALGIKKASFLGQAMGCSIATELAISFPTLVDRIILMSCPWFESLETRVRDHAIFFNATQPMDETGFPLPISLAERLRNDPEHCPMNATQSWADRRNIDVVLAGRHRNSMSIAGDSYYLPTHLARVECPVMHIWGEHFKYTQYRDKWEGLVKDYRVAIIEDARLDPQVDHPNEVCREVLSFLGS